MKIEVMSTMGSADKSLNDKKNKTRKCQSKDIFERMNYLYQVSNALATENEATNVASNLCSNLMIAISKKAVQRLDIEVKRTICKGCRSLLLAGINCKVRIKKKHSIWICTTCGTVKRFPLTNPDYKPWTQQSESIVEILDYQNSS